MDSARGRQDWQHQHPHSISSLTMIDLLKMPICLPSVENPAESQWLRIKSKFPWLKNFAAICPLPRSPASIWALCSNIPHHEAKRAASPVLPPDCVSPGSSTSNRGLGTQHSSAYWLKPRHWPQDSWDRTTHHSMVNHSIILAKQDPTGLNEKKMGLC